MLGGGNPVGGGSPASTGSNLNYLGQHVYANSGNIDIDQNDTTKLAFTSGAGYIVAKIQINNASGSSDDIKYTIKFNSEVISQFYYSGAGNQNEPFNPIFVIIPAETKVVISGENEQTTSPRSHTANITGRVYY